MLRSKLLFSLLILFQFHVCGQSTNYVFEQITSESGISFNAVSSIVEDDDGFLWFGTASGLYYYNSSEIVQYSYNPDDKSSPPSNRINSIYKDQNGLIWICTDRGICSFDKRSHSFSRLTFEQSDQSVSHMAQYDDKEYLLVMNGLLYHFNIDDQVLKEIPLRPQTSRISFLGRMKNGQVFLGTEDGKVYQNQSGVENFALYYQSASTFVTTISLIDEQLWIGYDDVLAGGGVEVVGANQRLVRSYKQSNTGDTKITSDRVRRIVQRENGDIWIGTAEGISVIDSTGMHHINQRRQFNRLPHISIFDLYVDQNDGVWVGTWSGGLAYYSDYTYGFPHIRVIKNEEFVSRSVISSFAEDENGSIWVGIENYNIEKFDPEDLTFIKTESPAPLSRIKSLATDRNNRQWIGTVYKGLWSLENDVFRRIGDLTGIFSSLLATDEGIWIGTRLSGLYFYDPVQDTLFQYRAEDHPSGSISSDRIWKVLEDSRGHIWICSDFGISVKYRGTKEFESFYFGNAPSGLSRDLNYTITEDSNGKLWIGTAGAGIDIYDPVTGQFGKFELNTSIEHAEVYCILEDQQGSMWFSSNQGIYAYHPQSNVLKNFTQQDGVLGKQFHPNSGFISSNGNLYFGGESGFYIIDPKTVRPNPQAPEVFLSKLLINNKTLSEQAPEYVNSKFPAAIDRIDLASDQNSLTIGLVANNLVKSSGNKFRYRMKNYLDDWIETSQGNDIVFTKIPPGNYTLEVLASNSDGIWTPDPKKILINIAPPFWLSWYAFLLYGLILLSSVVIVFRELRFREKSRADKILFSEKVKFFTNISHEFRTPLTLIISPLNNLMRKFEHDPSTLDHMKIIKRNADRLLHLTTQVLDFRLIELNKIKLRQEKADIVNLCRSAYDCFEYEATEKQINCVFYSSFKSFHLQVDAAKMEKIVYNLLSNGLKHSPERGQIILSIEEKELEENSYSKIFHTGHKFVGKALEIKVKDSGKGISRSNIPLIFNRFFVDHEQSETGIGIGLHMCQEYIHLHGGNIMVASEEGHGTTFTVNIPVDFQPEYKKEDTIIQYHFDKISSNKEEITPNKDRSKSKKLVLYVEDNDELRIYFKDLLSTKYKVLTAKNGQQALEIASEIIPDLIISDILMPGMNGLELTGQLRKSPSTDHIPIILLTALIDETYKLESMSKGASAYITKPVDESFLFAKVENLLKSQETIQKKIAGLTTEKLSALTSSDSFLVNAQKTVEQNLQNQSFSISEFAAQLNTSRSSLQRKLKAELNISPTEFIRDIRLKRAIELMKTGSYNIDEIGLLVGFNSTSYFIRSFKKKYGKTPFAFQSEMKLTQK